MLWRPTISLWAEWKFGLRHNISPLVTIEVVVILLGDHCDHCLPHIIWCIVFAFNVAYHMFSFLQWDFLRSTSSCFSRGIGTWTYPPALKTVYGTFFVSRRTQYIYQQSHQHFGSLLCTKRPFPANLSSPKQDLSDIWIYSLPIYRSKNVRKWIVFYSNSCSKCDIYRFSIQGPPYPAAWCGLWSARCIHQPKRWWIWWKHILRKRYIRKFWFCVVNALQCFSHRWRIVFSG